MTGHEQNMNNNYHQQEVYHLKSLELVKEKISPQDEAWHKYALNDHPYTLALFAITLPTLSLVFDFLIIWVFIN